MQQKVGDKLGVYVLNLKSPVKFSGHKSQMSR